MFFAKKNAATVPGDVPAGGYGASLIPGREPAFYEISWIRTLIALCVFLVVAAALYEAGVRIQHYGTQVVKKEFVAPKPGGVPMDLFLELKNEPLWLDKAIRDQISKETQDFASRDLATYNRLLDPLDKGILAEIAANYTAVDSSGINHWAQRENAWIKRITEVRRVISDDRQKQTIEIYAEYRVPAAWVLCSGKCYLIDSDFVRLPGDYSPADRKVTAELMAITGFENTTVPEPGVAWSGDDLSAGMQLATLLKSQPFVSQIDAIDVANFRGRRNPTESWIVLNTIWTTAGGLPRVVKWGRSLGEEKFFDVSASAKLKALNTIYVRFNRIDAGRDYVDVHGDRPQVPKLAAQVADDMGGRQPRG
jgi:hypothetical protein